jgi:hypothetical protein
MGPSFAVPPKARSGPPGWRPLLLGAALLQGGFLYLEPLIRAGIPVT